MARILLGVSGGVAAYKALELVRLATGAGHAVRVVQTPTSRRFVGEASFEALSGAPVLVSEFQRDPARGAFPDQAPPRHQPLSHLELAANADVYLIAPASANTIAKLAGGVADNLLCSCALAARCPIVLAPAMNNNMFEHPATQANLRALRQRGVVIVGPQTGRLASKGEGGVGRLTQPEALLEACEDALARRRAPNGRLRSADAPDADAARAGGDWRGVKVLVTAGGTREPIDSVRFLGNSSSGRMGLALAQAALARGADVTVIAANVALEPLAQVAWREVKSAGELQQACEQEFASCDVLLMAAAVSDFRPKTRALGKLERDAGESLSLQLQATADVVAALAKRRRADQTLVAFAAEHGQDVMLARARAKLSAKGVDAIVANDVSREDIGFQAEQNEVAIITADTTEHVARAPKAHVAEAILDVVAKLRSEGTQAPRPGCQPAA